MVAETLARTGHDGDERCAEGRGRGVEVGRDGPVGGRREVYAVRGVEGRHGAGWMGNGAEGNVECAAGS